MNFVEDLTITSLDEIRVFDIATGDYKFTLDELQDATISNTEDKIDIIGRAGRKLSTIKRNKAVTITGTNGMLSTGLMGVQTGTDVETSNAIDVDWAETLDINSSNVATLTKTPKNGTVDKVYLLDKHGVISGNALTLTDSTLSTGKYKLTNDGGTISITFFADDIAALDDDEYTTVNAAVFYTRSVAGSKVKNTDEISDKKYSMYIDGTAENKCGEQFRIQFHIPKASFSGNFDIALGGDQVVHAFEVDALAGGCNGKSDFWNYVVFGETAANA